MKQNPLGNKKQFKTKSFKRHIAIQEQILQITCFHIEKSFWEACCNDKKKYSMNHFLGNMLQLHRQQILQGTCCNYRTNLLKTCCNYRTNPQKTRCNNRTNLMKTCCNYRTNLQKTCCNYITNPQENNLQFFFLVYSRINVAIIL